ncbi:MAG: tetratricopeptide repeat protein [Oligoflexia bacterium]|nr:tetratricopeptide repeat protein [Oligoflexia bacterium]
MLKTICQHHATQPFPRRFQFSYTLETMLRLQIQLLGTFQVLQNGRSLTGFRTDKIRALLAYLAVESDRPHRRDTLAALFWPDMDDQKARYNLRLSLHRLRQTLGDDALALQVDQQSAQFDTTQSWVDVLAFEQMTTAVSTHAHPQLQTCATCMARLETAVAHYHGDFLPGFFLTDDLPFAEWVTTQRERLHQKVLQALDWLIAFYRYSGRLTQTIPYARRQLELEPWRESAHRQMMQALAVTGQPAAALRQYETCCRILRDELGIEPAAETTALYNQIRSDRMTWQQSGTVHETQIDTLLPHRLPTLLAAPFIGRQEELNMLNSLLPKPEVRLVTIVGAGGMGKTRLAQTCLETQFNHFAQGVYFVPLTSVTNANLILPAIAKTLNFTPDPSDTTRSVDQQLLDYLQPRQILLLLDNFEQLLDNEQGQTSTAVLHKLLQHSLEIKLLITSRERLHIQAEHVLPLGGLPCPAVNERDIGSYSSVQLFQQSARRLQSDFALTPDDIPHLIVICRLLEGMPLGLELAATWIDLLPLAEIAAEIQNSIDFLATDVRDWPNRHRSLRAVFDTSWARLSLLEQDLFPPLSLFRDGFTRAAVQAVVGGGQKHTDVLRLLSSLVSKSLLHYDRLADRYSLHELLRQYSAEKLTDEEARERHGQYYCSWLADQTAALKGDRQKVTLAAIEADMDNIRAAWNWAVDRQDLALLSAAAFSLGTFLYRQGRHQEGQILFSQTVAAFAGNAPTDHQIALARLLYWQGMFEPVAATRQDLLKSALAILETIVPDQTQRTGQAAILLELGIVAYGQGQHEPAERYFEQSLVRCRLAGDRWGEASVLCEMGVNAWIRGEYDHAALRYGQSLAIREALQDHVGMAVALEGLAGTAMTAKEGAQAIAYTRQSLEIYRQLEDRVGMAVLQAELGHKNWYQHLTGIELIEDSLRIFADLGTRRHLAHWTVILGSKKADVDIDAGEKLAHDGLALCQAIGYQRGVALAYGVLSRAAWMREDYDRAQELARIYLRIAEELSISLERSEALTMSAWAYMGVGQWEKAESLVCEVLRISNLWQEACLNLAAILLAHHFPAQSDRAWQVLGYGESRYARHRGAVSQQMISRFMPAAMKAVPPLRVNRLKQEGQLFAREAIFLDLLAALA